MDDAVGVGGRALTSSAGATAPMPAILPHLPGHQPERQDALLMRHSFRTISAVIAAALLVAPAGLGAQQIVFPRPAAAQQADHDGRTLLPMRVARSIAFRSIGPAVSGGRVSAVAGVAGQNDTYYVGTADGGVFRTTNGGITWTAEFQHQHALSIGALAVDPVNPEVVWAGTGEGNVRNNVSFGDGVFKSTDGGAHWTSMGLRNTLQIPRIVIDPNDPNTVFVAAMGNPWKDDPERGVFRTQDGGRTWQKVLYTA
ncbi:MAG: WD40/YVTN/BNR-like repeat-containing protein, partial [Gemmatimonadaceae bacterium]